MIDIDIDIDIDIILYGRETLVCSYCSAAAAAAAAVVLISIHDYKRVLGMSYLYVVIFSYRNLLYHCAVETPLSKLGVFYLFLT